MERNSRHAASKIKFCECFKIFAVETMLNKGLLNEEIEEKFGAFKENCFPKPSGGCRCNEKNARGEDTVATYNNDADCKISADGKLVK